MALREIHRMAFKRRAVLGLRTGKLGERHQRFAWANAGWKRLPYQHRMSATFETPPFAIVCATTAPWAGCAAGVQRQAIPSEATFSRAFAEFADSALPSTCTRR